MIVEHPYNRLLRLHTINTTLCSDNVRITPTLQETQIILEDTDRILHNEYSNITVCLLDYTIWNYSANLKSNRTTKLFRPLITHIHPEVFYGVTESQQSSYTRQHFDSACAMTNFSMFRARLLYLLEKYSSMVTIRLICFTLNGQRSSQCPHWRQASAWIPSLV